MSKKNGKKLQPTNSEILAGMYPDVQLLVADGFDDAIIGVDENDFRVIYSVKKCIEILMRDDDMTEEDALEHFSFNVSGSYVGEQTPIWCHDRELN